MKGPKLKVTAAKTLFLNHRLSPEEDANSAVRLSRYRQKVLGAKFSNIPEKKS